MNIIPRIPLFGRRPAPVTPAEEQIPTWVPEQTDRVIAALKDDLTQSHASLATRLDEIGRDLSRLSREQFQATTLLEGQGPSLDELTSLGQDILARQEREAADWHDALAELETRTRLDLVRDLLPVADGLAESVRAAREIRPTLDVVAPPPSPPSPPTESRRWAVLQRFLFRPTVENGEHQKIAGQELTVQLTYQASAQERRSALEAWLNGLLLVERRLLTLLEREDVRPIPTVGERFDPHRHLAVATTAADDRNDGMIVREELRGYTVNDRVLRPAEVIVARKEGEHG